MPAQVLGSLAGPGAHLAPRGLRLYGTDLGRSFQHRKQLLMLFGDTWPTARAGCNAPSPSNDDPLATLPLAYTGGVPPLTFVTAPDAPLDLEWIHVYRGSASLPMGWGRTPLAGFSDGIHAVVMFWTSDHSMCESDAASSSNAPSCRVNPELICTRTAGVCQPQVDQDTPLCNSETQEGCAFFQTCVANAPGFCFDRSSSLYNASDGDRSGVASNLDISVQRASSPATFDSAFVYSTSKFINVSARTVTSFTGHLAGNDYKPGLGTVLIWGRPHYWAEHERQAQLYLMTHPLPLAFDASGQLLFEPQYFAGVDANTGEPQWSPQQTSAKAIALDGSFDGDPHEELKIVDQMSINWLGPPISKWIMIYGGGQLDSLLDDPATAAWARAPGALAIRFADQPWGPFSPPEPYLEPGNPGNVGDQFGPGGLLFHYACEDQPSAKCARTDPVRTPDIAIPGCPTPPVQTEIGHFYAPNIIDEYTAPNGADGLDIIWNVSTWNPYDVVLLKTTIRRGT